MVNNLELHKKSKQFPIKFILWKRRLQWLGHVIRLSEDNQPKIIVNSNTFPNTQKLGIKRKKWEKIIKEDVKVLKMKNWEKQAMNKTKFNNSIDLKLNELNNNYLDGHPLYS